MQANLNGKKGIFVSIDRINSYKRNNKINMQLRIAEGKVVPNGEGHPPFLRESGFYSQQPRDRHYGKWIAERGLGVGITFNYTEGEDLDQIFLWDSSAQARLVKKLGNHYLTDNGMNLFPEGHSYERISKPQGFEGEAREQLFAYMTELAREELALKGELPHIVIQELPDSMKKPLFELAYRFRQERERYFSEVRDRLTSTNTSFTLGEMDLIGIVQTRDPKRRAAFVEHVKGWRDRI